MGRAWTPTPNTRSFSNAFARRGALPPLHPGEPGPNLPPRRLRARVPGGLPRRSSTETILDHLNRRQVLTGFRRARHPHDRAALRLARPDGGSFLPGGVHDVLRGQADFILVQNDARFSSARFAGSRAAQDAGRAGGTDASPCPRSLPSPCAKWRRPRGSCGGGSRSPKRGQHVGTDSRLDLDYFINRVWAQWEDCAALIVPDAQLDRSADLEAAVAEPAAAAKGAGPTTSSPTRWTSKAWLQRPSAAGPPTVHHGRRQAAGPKPAAETADAGGALPAELRFLAAQATDPQERERIVRAYYTFAQGTPESATVQFALLGEWRCCAPTSAAAQDVADRRRPKSRRQPGARRSLANAAGRGPRPPARHGAGGRRRRAGRRSAGMAQGLNRPERPGSHEQRRSSGSSATALLTLGPLDRRRDRLRARRGSENWQAALTLGRKQRWAGSRKHSAVEGTRRESSTSCSCSTAAALPRRL